MLLADGSKGSWGACYEMRPRMMVQCEELRWHSMEIRTAFSMLLQVRPLKTKRWVGAGCTSSFSLMGRVWFLASLVKAR